ncbi:MAG: hypothetical protein HC886_11010 [Leptolyngbyaceae cyanobacterium SM1_1_3]|nr:hypothetical protein [Leptolyngbyaceae cyanobacterium SM1_1_3]NJM84773.1 hypothetical protein [Leptolyngbyaceae cyanobacterium RM2_2_21]NJN02054.1 hypothetical protein [Leptolyngbyaceae cyanobacterium RM1_1_2]NJO09224.1 hypothetical protein [Leptolyngbyaceae cyanobacterium SL_1_1]
MISRLQFDTQIFLGVLTVTLIVWVLRGFALLAFLPGIVLWLLLLLCFGSGIFLLLRRLR